MKSKNEIEQRIATLKRAEQNVDGLLLALAVLAEEESHMDALGMIRESMIEECVRNNFEFAKQLMWVLAPSDSPNAEIDRQLNVAKEEDNYRKKSEDMEGYIRFLNALVEIDKEDSGQ